MRDTIAVYALWRDSELHIERTLSQLEDLEGLDYDFEYYFYENDSRDNTFAILSDWIKPRSGKFKSEKLNKKKFGSTTDYERVELLSNFRNKCKDLGAGSDSKYSLLIDSDIIFNKNNLQQSLDLINKCIAVSPNVRQNIPDYVGEKNDTSYYDVFPFIDRFGNSGNYWDDCPFKNGIDRMNWSLGNPVKAISCFGGFFFLRSETFYKVDWSTDGGSEHVNFCKDLSKHGEILIDPKNKVYTELDLSKFNLNNFKQRAKLQR